MKDKFLKEKVNKLTTYTDDVSPRSWCELVDELVSEIESLELSLDNERGNTISNE